MWNLKKISIHKSIETGYIILKQKQMQNYCIILMSLGG